MSVFSAFFISQYFLTLIKTSHCLRNRGEVTLQETDYRFGRKCVARFYRESRLGIHPSGVWGPLLGVGPLESVYFDIMAICLWISRLQV